jgi:diguanylate cyclase (GGDEF)-like protein
MSDRPGGFSEDTNATPLVRLSDASASGPKRPCLVIIAGPRLGEIYPVEKGELLIGRDGDMHLKLDGDESVSRRHAAVKVEPGASDNGATARVRDLGSANGTWLDGRKIEGEAILREGQKIRVGQTVVLKYALYDQLEELAQRQLLEAALRDGLTHAFNRRYFLQRLAAEIRFAERHAQNLALLMLDIDHFKLLNDTHGHPTGDKVLRKLVAIINDALRAEDVLARYGGEEFAVLARGISPDHAGTVAERLRKIVESATLHDGVKVTVSIGLAIFPMPEKADDPAQKLIELADAALYRAKQAGRNRVDGQ